MPGEHEPGASQDPGLLVLCQLDHHYHLIKPGLVR